MIYKLPFKEITIIWWLDAFVTLDDKPQLDKKAGDHLTVSFGHKVKEDNNYIYLSHFYDGITGSFDAPYTSIPRGMIHHVEKIKINRGSVRRVKARVNKPRKH